MVTVGSFPGHVIDTAARLPDWTCDELEVATAQQANNALPSAGKNGMQREWFAHLAHVAVSARAIGILGHYSTEIGPDVAAQEEVFRQKLLKYKNSNGKTLFCVKSDDWLVISGRPLAPACP